MNGLKLFLKTILCCFMVSCASTKIRIINDCKIKVQYPDMVEENILELKDAGNFLYRGCDDIGLIEVLHSLPYNYSNEMQLNDYSHCNYIEFEVCNCYNREIVFDKLVEQLKNKYHHNFVYSYMPAEIWSMKVIDTIKFIKSTQRKHFTEFTLANYEEQKKNIGRDTIRFHPLIFMWGNHYNFEAIRSSFKRQNKMLKIYAIFDYYMNDPDYLYSFSSSCRDFLGCRTFKEFQLKFRDKFGIQVDRKEGNRVSISRRNW